MRRIADRFLVRAPSNIALVKYMGKTDSVLNLPENGSISMTLEDLCTYAEIQVVPEIQGKDGKPAIGFCSWVPEAPAGAPPLSRVPRLDSAGLEKVIRHMERVRGAAPDLLESFGLDPGGLGSGRDRFILRSANTFPQSSGIASSASSFAAITLATAWACGGDPEDFRKVYTKNPEFPRALAELSRRGSGSSCRSFEGPWVAWEGGRARAIDATLPPLRHLVLVVSESTKRVSSSEAHLRIKGSPLWRGRVDRAETRKRALSEALLQGDLRMVAKLAWSEAWEMHSLFHTAEKPFSYWEPATLDLLQGFAGIFEADEAELPILTLDAGPNIHLICPADQAEPWKSRINANFKGISVLEDRPGIGARLISAVQEAQVGWP